MLFVKLISVGNGSPTPINLRCPKCRREGVFQPVKGFNDIANGGLWLGHRSCPNRECLTHLFVIHKGTEVVATYPPERLDFDGSNIPQPILDAFEEALTCHANDCFVAAAMLIRKSLEHLCDERGAAGKDLKDRIQLLRTKVILPDTLFEAIDHLRLLGNDAAHIESKTYNDVGSDEILAAVALTKEILKAVYQYDSLLIKLKSLKQ